MLVWGGSILVVIAGGVRAVLQSSGSVRALVLVATLVYLLGVQVSTFVNNIPLNNQLQRHNLDQMSADELVSVRMAFEPRWNEPEPDDSGVRHLDAAARRAHAALSLRVAPAPGALGTPGPAPVPMT